MFKFLNKYFHSNNKNLKSENTFYPYCEVAYKTDDSIGWNLAIFDGDEKFVTEKCKKSNWYDFVVLSVCTSRFKIKDNLNYYPEADNVHLFTNWIYWNDLDKWFIKQDEIIPYPLKICEVTNKIQFSYDFEECDNDADSFIKGEDLYVTAEVSFETKTQKVDALVQISKLYEEFENFIDNLKNKKFAVCHIWEFSNFKLLAWEKDEKIRFVIQDYNPKDEQSKPEYIPIAFAVLVDKNIFFEYFIPFYNSLKAKSEELLQEMNKERKMF